jgi:putative selenate reductase YgfK subunit
MHPTCFEGLRFHKCDQNGRESQRSLLMTNYSCPVKRISLTLSEILASGRITQFQFKQGIETLLKLLDEISSGSGKTGHIHSIEAIAKMLMEEGDNSACIETGRKILSTLEEQRDSFLSHIGTHYCSTGECSSLRAAPCQLACPAGVDAPSYVALVGMGRYREALAVLREDLPFPASLGRVCFHPCEKACRRGMVDEPIAICQLKRVAFDKAYEQGREPVNPTPHHFKEKIAIIGSGPAGLSTAYFLAKKGYRPEVFESMPEPGGMLRWGIPGYRLPRKVLKMEIDYIKAMGVDILTRVAFGGNLTLEHLKNKDYKAVFLGIGAHRPMALAIPGERSFSGVQDCLSFLYQASLGKAAIGKRVCVIGGGNAAIDCARTALRLDVDEVHLVYRRTRREMPANPKEIREAEEEGTIIDLLLSPIRIHGQNGRVSGLECIKNRLSETDATGRRRPVPLEGTEQVLPADTVISAIGQEVDTSSLKGIDELGLTENRLVIVNPETGETSIPGIFAGGDVVTGPATVVEAVASGKKAAAAIHCYLRGKPFSDQELIPIRRRRVPVMRISAQEKALSSRPKMPQMELEERHGNFQEVEYGLAEEDAVQEAKRCLRCDICISCGRCVEVCRDLMGIEAIHLSYVEQNKTAETDFLRPSEYCIGCGSCAMNCPTEAISIDEQDARMIIRMCGSEMSRHILVPCASCGIPFITQKHLDYVDERADTHTKVKYPRNLCPTCARTIRAETMRHQITLY